MQDYIRKVNYCETDKMGIVHHSNYVRWLEEARIDFLEQINCSLVEIEKHGIVSPVTEVGCSYKTPTVFGDTVRISVKIQEFKGVRLVLDYEIYNNKTNALVLTAQTQHCFTGGEGKPVVLKKVLPEYDKRIKECIG
ncbi:MAG: acyl-CoA thioesterase [Clostridia bacterium]|nr:acyl-CoA thioesterase [Clostridia bacterium]